MYQIEKLEEGGVLEVHLPVAPQPGGVTVMLYRRYSSTLPLWSTFSWWRRNIKLNKLFLAIRSSAHAPVSISPLRPEHPVRQLEEEFRGVICDNGHLASAAPVCQDCGEGDVVEDALLVEQEIVHVDVESSGKLDP